MANYNFYVGQSPMTYDNNSNAEFNLATVLYNLFKRENEKRKKEIATFTNQINSTSAGDGLLLYYADLSPTIKTYLRDRELEKEELIRDLYKTGRGASYSKKVKDIYDWNARNIKMKEYFGRAIDDYETVKKMRESSLANSKNDEIIFSLPKLEFDTFLNSNPEDRSRLATQHFSGNVVQEEMMQRTLAALSQLEQEAEFKTDAGNTLLRMITNPSGVNDPEGLLYKAQQSSDPNTRDAANGILNTLLDLMQQVRNIHRYDEYDATSKGRFDARLLDGMFLGMSGSKKTTWRSNPAYSRPRSGGSSGLTGKISKISTTTGLAIKQYVEKNGKLPNVNDVITLKYKEGAQTKTKDVWILYSDLEAYQQNAAIGAALAAASTPEPHDDSSVPIEGLEGLGGQRGKGGKKADVKQGARQGRSDSNVTPGVKRHSTLSGAASSVPPTA